VLVEDRLVQALDAVVGCEVGLERDDERSGGPDRDW